MKKTIFHQIPFRINIYKRSNTTEYNTMFEHLFLKGNLIKTTSELTRSVRTQQAVSFVFKILLYSIWDYFSIFYIDTSMSLFLIY